MFRFVGLPMLALTVLGGCGGRSEPATLVAVASSLREALPEILQRFSETPGAAPVLATYGGSGTLRAQVEAGAPIDAVVFAGAGPVDELVESGRLLLETRRVIATNRLVLVSSGENPGLRFATLDRLAEGELIAIGAPEAAPVGAYARDLLRALDLWEVLRERLVFGGHVAAVLAYVRRGEVAAGIVYRTDVLSLSDVHVLDAAPDPGTDSGPAWGPGRGPGVAPGAPQVVAAVSAGARDGANARHFVAFLGSREAGRILERYGFGVFDDGRSARGS